MSLSPLLRSARCQPRRWLSTTSVSRAITKFKMPAMNASWKKREGDSFTAGDVLLEIETDKAVIDVEAQDDGIMGKILVQDGQKNIPVGKAIALLAEEGDDISNIEVSEDVPELSESAPAPKQEPQPLPPQSTSTQTPTPKATHRVSHSRPLFPSVARPEKIKGTGIRGMLTKATPTGTFKPAQLKPESGAPKAAKAKAEKAPLYGLAIRQLIVQNMYQTAAKARAATVPQILADFDSVIADYIPPSTASAVKTTPPILPSKGTSGDFLDGLV
ncbi:hypothetical protein BJV77DRAFT_1058605 [Russula vinacea]|nr:hypothetical protein BJV77DRAFT_1058605 [Russula vinacea]